MAEYFEINVLSGIRLSRIIFPDVETKLGKDNFYFKRICNQYPEEMIHYGMTKTAWLAISRGLAGLLKKQMLRKLYFTRANSI
jgi:hypothetical protein